MLTYNFTFNYFYIWDMYCHSERDKVLRYFPLNIIVDKLSVEKIAG